MIQTIDIDYLQHLVEQPGGWQRLYEMTGEWLQQRDDAVAIARAVVRDAEPMRRQIRDLQLANTLLVEERCELRALLAGRSA